MDFEAMKVSNLGDAAAELPESAECFSAEAAIGHTTSYVCNRLLIGHPLTVSFEWPLLPR